MASVVWTELALEDLEAIRSFIARDSRVAAESFALRVFEATQMLEDYPMAGRMVPEIHNPELRELIVGSYRVIYRLRGDVAEVLTLHHGARSL